MTRGEFAPRLAVKCHSRAELRPLPNGIPESIPGGRAGWNVTRLDPAVAAENARQRGNVPYGQPRLLLKNPHYP